MTREEPRSKSIAPAIVHIHPSSEPISPEKKEKMLREIDEIMRRHNMLRKTELRPGCA